MTKPKIKRTPSAWAGMVTRRDRKIADLQNANMDARAALVDAVRVSKNLAAEIAALKHNIALMTNPANMEKRAAKEMEKLRYAEAILRTIKSHALFASAAIHNYETQARKKL